MRNSFIITIRCFLNAKKRSELCEVRVHVISPLRVRIVTHFSWFSSFSSSRRPVFSQVGTPTYPCKKTKLRGHVERGTEGLNRKKKKCCFATCLDIFTQHIYASRFEVNSSWTDMSLSDPLKNCASASPVKISFFTSACIFETTGDFFNF